LCALWEYRVWNRGNGIGIRQSSYPASLGFLSRVHGLTRTIYDSVSRE